MTATELNLTLSRLNMAFTMFDDVTDTLLERYGEEHDRADAWDNDPDNNLRDELISYMERQKEALTQAGFQVTFERQTAQFGIKPL